MTIKQGITNFSLNYYMNDSNVYAAMRYSF